MKAFVETYPAFKKQSGTVNKHVVLGKHVVRIQTNFSTLDFLLGLDL